MAKWLRIVLAGSAIAAAALAFMQSNRGPWSSDPGVGLVCVPAARAESISLIKDAGDVSCWLRLRLAAASSVMAVTLDQHILRAERDGEWWRITEPISTNPMRPNSLQWYAGGQIRILGSNLALEDWELYRSDAPMDSSTKERSRRRWFGLFVILLTVGTTGGVAQILWPAKDRRPPLTAEYCVLLLIDTLEAKRPEQTMRMRDLLTLTLLTRRVDRVVALPRERGLFEQGRRQLAERLDVLIATLEARRRRLG
jgi:hypothetical protein